MQPQDRISTAIKILLPLVFVLVLNISPLPHRYVEGLQGARQAQAGGQHALAAANFSVAIEQMPWRLDLYEKLANEASAAGQADQALGAFQAAQSAGLLSLEGQFNLGELYAARGEIDQAISIWNTLAEQPGFAASILPARLYDRIYTLERSRGRLSEAVAALESWRQYEPSNPELAYLTGLTLSLIDPSRALPPLMEASQGDARFQERVDVLRAGLNLASVAEDPAYGWLMIGRSLAQLNEWDLAQAAFEKSVQLAPGYGEAWAFLGEARYHNGLPGEEALENAQAVAPDSAVVRALAALYWRRTGKPQQALQSLQLVAQQEPDEPTWQIEIGNTQAESGDLIAARASFTRALQIAPDSLPVLKAVIGFSVQYNVDVQDWALPLARKLVNLSPHDAESLDLMGRVFMTLEDFSSAERFLQRSLEQDPQFAAAYLHLGQLYLQTNDTSGALACLRRANELAQEGPVGVIARRLLERYFNEGS